MTAVNENDAPTSGIGSFLRRHSIDTRPLRNVPYRRLFIGDAVGNFGFQFTAVAVPVQMFHLTGSSLWVGLLGVASLVPLLVFALWGGAVADVVDRRRLLIISSTLMWTVPIGLFTLALFDPANLGRAGPWLLLAFTAVQGGAFATSHPTRRAIVVRLVSRQELPAVNTLNTTVFNLGIVAGPLTAGLLVKDGHFGAAYAVDAVLFTIVLWAAVKLPPIPPLREDQAPNSRAAGWRDIGEGLRYLVTAPVLWLSFAIDIAAMVLAMPRSLFPEVAAERFGAGAIGWLYAAISIGAVVAGLTSGWIGRVRRQGLALVVSVVVWGLAVAGAGLADTVGLVVLLLAIGGAADLVSAVYRQTILQTYAPDGFQGRLQGIFTAVVAGGPRLGDLRAGAMAAMVGPTVAWVSGGVAAAVVSALLAVVFPALVRYPGRPPNR